MIKSREALLKMAGFDLAEKRRKLSDIEAMVAEFRRMAADLEQQIEAEHARTGVRDPNHFAYSSFAKAARKRSDNLLVSVADLEAKREAATLALETSEAEMKRVEQMTGRAADDQKSNRRRPGRGRPMSHSAPPRAP